MYNPGSKKFEHTFRAVDFKPIWMKGKSNKPGFFGPFHCRECADTAINFGKTVEQARDFVHGSADEKFGVFLGSG